MKLDSVLSLRDRLQQAVVLPLRTEQLVGEAWRRELWTRNLDAGPGGVRFGGGGSLPYMLLPGPGNPDGPWHEDEGRSAVLRALQPTMALGFTRSSAGEYCLAVRVHQQQLMGSSQLETIQREACGEVDVRYVGRVTPAGWYQKRARPLRLGASVGHHGGQATGTITGFVRIKDEPDVYLLSNNHVLANENAAAKGDLILQPGALDHPRNPGDEVGTLADFWSLKPGASNDFDCARARLLDGMAFEERRLHGPRRVRGVGPDRPDIGDRVFKVGRSTGPTRGLVLSYVQQMEVGYAALGLVIFSEFIEIEGESGLFCARGDSGSLIVDLETMKGVGMLVAVSEAGHPGGPGLGYATPLAPMLQQMNAEWL